MGVMAGFDFGQLPSWYTPPPPQQQPNWWAPPKDEASALPYLTIGTALQNLGNIWSNPGSQQNIMAGFAPLLQMKQGLADRKKMQDVIGQMQGLDPNVKAAMGLIPEQGLAAYVKNATEQQRAKDILYSTGRGLYSPKLGETGGIIPGTEPFPPNLQIKPVQSGADVTALVFDPRTGQGTPIAVGPKWNPDVQHGAGVGTVPAGHVQAFNITKIGPDGTPYTETQLVDIRPQRGGPTQMNPVPAPWQQDQSSAAPYTSKEAPQKPLPRDAQDDFKAAAQIGRGLDAMESNLDKTGVGPRGWMSEAGAYLGTDKGAIEFQTGQKNNAIAAQKLIPGIPSNKDSERLDAIQAQLTASKETNKSRIAFQRETMKELLQLKIGSYKGLGYKIPDSAIATARKYGVNPDNINAMSEDQVAAGTDAWRGKTDAFIAQQRAASLQAQPEQPAPAATTMPGPLPKISGDADYNALPSGRKFIDPTGKIRVKP